MKNPELLAQKKLPLIVIAQFACTSLWFAGNAVLTELITDFQLDESVLGHIVSAVQLGFISGTLVFAIFTLSDRFSPSSVFFSCALAGAFANLAVFLANGLPLIIISRFLTGFCLAGIYPVGMKIAADYHQKGLGKALGYLVGALVGGTALPHLLKTFTHGLPWQSVMLTTSFLSILGGLLIFIWVGDGPYRSWSQQLDFTVFFKIFNKKDFRSAAFGYFGHIWELYAFWAFIPVILKTYQDLHPEIRFSISFYSFCIIAIGVFSCIGGGYLSQKIGSGKTAFMALSISFLCCLISPLFFQLPFELFLGILLIWSMAVIADSPQFSTLVAQSADSQIKGTALTITNSIGFAITIGSIQLLNYFVNIFPPNYLYLVLAIGPLLGLFFMRKLINKTQDIRQEI
jgi:predicted MFS family arabinose efflux permease